MEQLDNLGNLNISDYNNKDDSIQSHNPNLFNNFSKTSFTFNNTSFELGISVYSNLIFLILTSNGKLGSFCIGELENKDLLDPQENIYEVQCLLGDRKDENNQFLCNNIITHMLMKIADKEKYNKIEKVLMSTAIKFSELFAGENGDLAETKEFKDFVVKIKSKIGEVLNI